MLPIVELILPTLKGAEFVISNADRYAFELKFDGFRCAAYVENNQVRLFTKLHKEHRGFEFIKQGIKELSLESAIFDGEIVCLDDNGKASFTELLKRRRAQYYYVFDLLWLDGKDLRRLPLEERKKILEGLLQGRRALIRYVPGFSGDETFELIKVITTENMEGVIAKLKGAAYNPKLANNWVKILNKSYSQYQNRWKLFTEKRNF